MSLKSALLVLISSVALAQVKLSPDAGVVTKPAPTPVATALDAGLVKQATTLATKGDDGGTVYVSTVQLKDGGSVITTLDHSPCRRRPAGVKATTCMRKLADGGTQDQGDLNVMQAGQWLDNGGCEEAACVVIFGKERFK